MSVIQLFKPSTKREKKHEMGKYVENIQPSQTKSRPLSLLERRNMERLTIPVDVTIDLNEDKDGLKYDRSALSPWDTEVQSYLKRPRRKAISNTYKHQVMFSWVIKKMTVQKLQSRKTCANQH